ncbi:ATP-binding protein [Piscinibacterium candidicorallinum]|uniref:histidine kinase n=1 Tax=Piscinibacterium candidicorallinum TaxID=1793872 RepID=A0ABV7H5J3_9BURK
MSAELQDEPGARLESELVRLLYRGAPLGQAAVVLAALLFAWLLRNTVPLALIAAWLAAVLINTVWRAWRLRQYQQTPERLESPEWLAHLRIGVLINALLWCLLGISAVIWADLTTKLAVMTLLVGMSAGGLAMLAADARIYQVFMVGVLAPVLVGFIVLGGELGWSLTALTAFLVFVLHRSCTYVNRVLVQSVRLRLEREQAAANQERLNARLVAQNEALREEAERHRRTQSALSEARNAAEEATLAKTAFLAQMSHEVRTPLNGVIGMTGLVLAGPLREDQRRHLSMAQQSAESLLAILNDVLDVTKSESGRIAIESVPVRLDEIAEQVCQAFRAEADRKSLKLAGHWPATLPAVMADPLRMRQVLMNLVGNAIKFTNSGSVALDLSQQGFAQEAVRVRFEVKDTGIGISAAALNTIFRPFEQVDRSVRRSQGGAGLGLSISEQLVQRMGGELGVRSEPGVGSEFFFELSLPLAEQDTLTAGDIGTAAPATELNGYRVLLVEDNAVNRAVAEGVIALAGGECLSVVNGLQAVREVVERGTDHFDAVLMDIHMPNMDGFEATRAIRLIEAREAARSTAPAAAAAGRLPIIAMTADAMYGERDKALTAGMDEYLTKPFKPEDLIRLVRKVAEARRPYTGRLVEAMPATH